MLRALQAADRRATPEVCAFVAKSNPALRLYRRLGFVEIGDSGLYLGDRVAARRGAGGDAP